MQTHEVVGIIAGVIGAVGAIPYVADTLRGRTRPNRATWTVYAVVGSCAVVSSFAAGGTWSLLVGVAYALGPMAILLASIRHGEGGWNPLDRWCLLGAAAGLAAWWFTGDPRVGVWLHTGVDALGTLPTWVKAWRDPAHENRRAWTIYAVGSTLNLFAIAQWTVGEAVYAVWLVVCCVSVAGILWWRGGKPALQAPSTAA